MRIRAKCLGPRKLAKPGYSQCQLARTVHSLIFYHESFFLKEAVCHFSSVHKTRNQLNQLKIKIFLWLNVTVEFCPNRSTDLLC